MKRYGKQQGVISRECSGCGGDLGDRYMKQRYCKSCHAAHMRRTRPKHKDLPDDRRKKANARSYANVYQSRGFLKKQPCRDCGSNNSQKHHDDYSKPLEVIWLCRPCHLKIHNEVSVHNNCLG